MKRNTLCKCCCGPVTAEIDFDEQALTEEYYDCPHCGYHRRWAYGVIQPGDSEYTNQRKERIYMSKEKCKLLWWLNQDTTTHYNFMELVYDGAEHDKVANTVSRHPVAIERASMAQKLKDFDVIVCNAKLNEDGTMSCLVETKDAIIENTARAVREYLEVNYGEDVMLSGYEMEACALLQAALRLHKFEANIVTGECMCDYDIYNRGSTNLEHHWVEVQDVSIDITADQFNPALALRNHYNGVTITSGIPEGMRLKETHKITNTPIRLLAYELYKRDWMKRHIPKSHEMATLFDWFSENQSDYIADEGNYEPQSLEAFIDERGYDGSIYACFNEFLSEEYLDHVYIEGLLVDAGYVAGLLPVYYVDVQELL